MRKKGAVMVNRQVCGKRAIFQRQCRNLLRGASLVERNPIKTTTCE